MSETKMDLEKVQLPSASELPPEDDPAEDIDLETLEEIQQVTEEYAKNPHSMEVGTKLARIYIKLKWHTKLRNLLNSLHSLYTLPEALWEDWLHEEMIISKSDDEKKAVLQLFQKATDDLLYFEVAKLYAKYVEQLYSHGILRKNQVKIIYERLIAQFGNDFIRGSKFIKKLRKFEIANPEKTKPEELVKIVRSSYLRQLKIPIADIDLTWEEYCKWEKDDNEVKKSEEIYNSTYKVIENYLNLDEKLNQILESGDLLNLKKFLQQISDDSNHSIEKKINFFEKSLERYFSSEDVWEVYCDFAQRFLTVNSQKEKLYNRAVKNCSGNAGFALLLLRTLEAQGNQLQEIEEKAEKILKELKENREGAYLVWLYLCEAHARVLNSKLKEVKYDLGKFNEMHKLEINSFRLTIQRAIDYHEANAELNAHYIENLYFFWGMIETYTLKSKEKMNHLMEKYIHQNGSKYNSWMIYINLELSIGNTNSVRGLIKRGCEYIKDDVYSIHNYAVEFERKFGSLDELEKTELKLKEKTQKIKDEIQNQQALHAQKVQQAQVTQTHNKDLHLENKKNIKKRNIEEVYENDQELMEANELHRKKMIKTNEESDHPKRVIFLDQRNTVYVKNFPTVFTEEDVKAIFSEPTSVTEVRLIKDKTGTPKGYGYVDFNTPEAANEAVKCNGLVMDGKKLLVALSNPPKKGKYDENTLFLNNLPFNITEDMVREAFSTWKDDIKEIRIIRKEDGQARGYGFIEFNTKETYEKVSNTVKTVDIEGRRVVISGSDSLKKQETTLHAINVILVKSLPFDADEDDVKTLFRGFKIKQLHLIRGKKSGKSKGSCFVEFEDNHDVKRALSWKNPMMNGRALEIVKSDREITTSELHKEAPKAKNFLSKKDAMIIEEEPKKEGMALEERKQGNAPNEAIPQPKTKLGKFVQADPIKSEEKKSEGSKPVVTIPHKVPSNPTNKSLLPSHIKVKQGPVTVSSSGTSSAADSKPRENTSKDAVNPKDGTIPRDSKDGSTIKATDSKDRSAGKEEPKAKTNDFFRNLVIKSNLTQ